MTERGEAIEIGPYRVRGVLGEGGSSVVYLASSGDDDVALKWANADQHEHADNSGRLEREARLLTSFDEPSVVRVRDSGRHEARAFLALEHANAGCLSDRLVAGLPGDLWAVTRVADTLDASLGVMHPLGWVHRDVHPGNLLLHRPGAALRGASVRPPTALVEPDERIWLCDFGIAWHRDLDDPAPQRTVGTPLFRAPEQVDPTGPPTPAADVYGATATLWSVLTGVSPPEVDAVDDALDSLPVHWQAFLGTGLAATPTQRFDSIAGWRSALDVAIDVELSGAAPAR